jgi:uncharacterized protein
VSAPEHPAPARPGPHPTPVTRPYWEATTRDELLLQRCGECGRCSHYPRSHCPTCWSPQLTWVTASGGGELVSATTIHRPGHPAFAALVPYVVGLVDLDEGARLLANIDRPSARELLIGERLALRWEDHGSYRLPWFHPTTGR